MKSIYDEYRPRNEREICELFEDLLFLKTEKFSPGLSSEKNDHELSDKDIALLSKTGILNRIFRRWFQTTFGHENVSEYFNGETPRQELTRIKPRLGEGKEYLSVNLERIEGEWRVIPYYSSEELLKKEGGVFMSGFKNLEKAKKQDLVNPQFDIGFETFVYLLKEMEKFKKKNNKELSFNTDFAKYLGLFLELGISQVVLNCGIKFNKKEFNRTADNFYNCLTYYFSKQSYKKDNYLSSDEIIFAFWNILRENDKELPSFEKIINIDYKKKRIEKEPDFKKTVEIFYRLNKAFDAYVLFPIERYFGLAEIVWTDKVSFFDDLGITFNLLKNNLKVKADNIEKGAKYLNINDIAWDLKYIWFCPCHSFRMLGPAFQYFH